MFNVRRNGKRINLSVHFHFMVCASPHLCCGGGWVLTSNQSFKKAWGRLGRTSTFRGGLLVKRGGGDFIQGGGRALGGGGGGGGGCNLHIKNKLKSEIVNDKKSL